MIAMDGVERVLAKMHERAENRPWPPGEDRMRQLAAVMSYSSRERKYLRLRNPSLHLTRPGLKGFKDVPLHEPKLPWRLLGVG